jgi:hypothetical protein
MEKIIAAIFVFLLTIPVGYCENQHLQLTIKSDKPVYEMGEEIKLQVMLKNSSKDKEIILFWSNEKATLQADKFNVVVATIPALQGTKLENIYIKPKETITRNVSAVNELRPSKSQFTLRYTIPKGMLDFKTGPKQEVWSQPLVSNTITIEIQKKK